MKTQSRDMRMDLASAAEGLSLGELVSLGLSAYSFLFIYTLVDFHISKQTEVSENTMPCAIPDS